jgi:hypothetical protein
MKMSGSWSSHTLLGGSIKWYNYFESWLETLRKLNNAYLIIQHSHSQVYLIHENISVHTKNVHCSFIHNNQTRKSQ